MPELTRQSLWCSQPEHRPTMSHQISQGRKKCKAWLGLQPRTSRILCEHSDYWATEPQSTCDTLYKLRSYYVFLNWIIWTKRKHYHQCKTKTSVNEKIHNSYFWRYIAKYTVTNLWCYRMYYLSSDRTKGGKLPAGIFTPGGQAAQGAR